MATPIPKNRAVTTASDAAAATRGRVLRNASGNGTACGIVSDTRAIGGGEAFVALRGEHHDGHAFLTQAAARGAALLVVDAEPAIPEGPAVVRVSDTLAAWGDLARAHVSAWREARAAQRSEPLLGGRGGEAPQNARVTRSETACVVAITGSAGKTTTKQLCAALLAEVSSTLASPGNLNNLVGVPAVLFLLEPEHRFAVVECGMSVRGEIARLAAMVTPDVAVITNVSVAHAEGVGGSREDVAREKGALFDALRADGACVFDADDPVCALLAARCRASRKVGFGRGADAQYRMSLRVSLGLDGSRVTIERPAAPPIEVELPFVGEAAAIDLCAALAAADAAAGPLSQEVVARAMKRVKNVDGRSTLHSLPRNVLVIDDSYNANPVSMRAALSTLADLAKGRRSIAVLGEMKELGDSARGEHVALGDELAKAHVSLVIGCGALAAETVARAKALGVDAVDCSSVDEASAVVLERVRPNDVVLVKGSRSVGAERIVAALKGRVMLP